jgi:hypothetical protein
MFPYADAQARLDLHHQHVAEMVREAAAYRRARSATGGRHRRFGRWPRHGGEEPGPVSVPA